MTTTWFRSHAVTLETAGGVTSPGPGPSGSCSAQASASTAEAVASIRRRGFMLIIEVGPHLQITRQNRRQTRSSCLEGKRHAFARDVCVVDQGGVGVVQVDE